MIDTGWSAEGAERGSGLVADILRRLEEDAQVREALSRPAMSESEVRGHLARFIPLEGPMTTELLASEGGQVSYEDSHSQGPSRRPHGAYGLAANGVSVPLTQARRGRISRRGARPPGSRPVEHRLRGLLHRGPWSRRACIGQAD